MKRLTPAAYLLGGFILIFGIGSSLYYTLADEKEISPTVDSITPTPSKSEAGTPTKDESPKVTEEKTPLVEESKQEETTPPVPSLSFNGHFFGSIPQSFNVPLSGNPEVQTDITVGYHLLLTGRDIVANYYFQHALAIDPNNPMATLGLYLTLCEPGSEQSEQANKLILNLQKFAEDPNISGQIKSYMQAGLAMAETGGKGAAHVLSQIAEHWRGDFLARLLAAQMLHEGYDKEGNPTLAQQAAQKLIQEALASNPENHAFLYTRALIEEIHPSISEHSLTECIQWAEKAVQLAPNNAPSHHLLGHFYFRQGNYIQSARELQKACDSFDASRNWLHVTLANDQEWLASQAYLATALFCSGNQKTGYDLSTQLASFPIDETRPKAEGSLIQEWELSTLPARLSIIDNRVSVLKQAKATLSKEATSTVKATDAPSLLYKKALYRYLAAREDLLTSAKKTTSQLPELVTAVEALDKAKPLAIESGALSYWIRAISTIKQLEYDLKARLYSEDENKWQDMACSHQFLASLLLPPTLPFPQEEQWAESLSKDHVEESLEKIQLGLQRFPKLPTLLALQAKIQGASIPENATITPISLTQQKISSSSSKSSSTSSRRSSSSSKSTKAKTRTTSKSVSTKSSKRSPSKKTTSRKTTKKR